MKRPQDTITLNQPFKITEIVGLFLLYNINGVLKKIRLFFFPKKITLFITLQGTVGSSYQIRGTCYQLWISYLRSHFALAKVDLHTFCAKTGSSSTSPLKASANLCPKQFMLKALFSSKLQVPFLNVEIPLSKACVCWAGGRTCPSSAGSA